MKNAKYVCTSFPQMTCGRLCLNTESSKQILAEFPQDPMEQLVLAVKAVFDSWNNQRAIVYRKINKIPDDLGTAVNVQPWSLATWEMIVAREWPLPGILLRGEPNLR